jgi:GT2 family glycosyltransferase
VIDVVIPVYKGLRETRRCVESVLGSPQGAPFEVVAIDDATPDPQIASYLDALAGQGRITLVRNERNRGFVQSVNLGMSRHPDRDVVLLNSDTEVANDWLDRLHRTATGHSDIGTVTPFSNSATICSYPFEGWAGGLPGTLGLAALDQLFAIVNAGRTVDLPTAVGFCMYIRRACLDRTGLFDADRFGRGYGEENDFCMRAAKAGWRSVLAGDVFVFHEGSVSFSTDREALQETADRALADIHPDYMRKVRAFVIRDPLNALREAVDNVRAARGADEEREVLAERAVERKVLKARLAAVMAESNERERVIAALNEERERAITAIKILGDELAERDKAITDLRAGLSHAEALAFERARELDRLRRSWLGRCTLYVMRVKSRWHQRLV